jgi:hypothetical protein
VGSIPTGPTSLLLRSAALIRFHALPNRYGAEHDEAGRRAGTRAGLLSRSDFEDQARVKTALILTELFILAMPS